MADRAEITVEARRLCGRDCGVGFFESRVIDGGTEIRILDRRKQVSADLHAINFDMPLADVSERFLAPMISVLRDAHAAS